MQVSGTAFAWHACNNEFFLQQQREKDLGWVGFSYYISFNENIYLILLFY